MDKDISFEEALTLARKVIKRFEKIEGKPWGIDGSMIELSKQVGDLAKLVMVYENYYFSDRDKLNKQYEATKGKIADELADILFAVIRIAEHYNIDLAKAHIEMSKDADNLLRSKGA